MIWYYDWFLIVETNLEIDKKHLKIIQKIVGIKI